MSVSDFEEQVFKYIWRGFVLAGLITLLWGFFAPTANTPTQTPGVTSTASNQTINSAASVATAINEAR